MKKHVAKTAKIALDVFIVIVVILITLATIPSQLLGLLFQYDYAIIDWRNAKVTGGQFVHFTTHDNTTTVLAIRITRERALMVILKHSPKP